MSSSVERPARPFVPPPPRPACGDVAPVAADRTPGPALDFDITDPDEFHASLPPGGSAHLVLAARGRFRARRRLRVGPDLTVAWGSITNATAMRVGTPRRANFALLDTGGRQTRVDGQARDATTLTWAPAGAEILVLNPGETPWWAFSVPLDAMEAAAATLYDEPPRPPPFVTRLAPILPARRRDILAGLGLAMKLPGGAPKAVSDGLLRLALEGFRPAMPDAGEERAARRRHVVDGLLSLADRPDGEPRTLIEICAELAVPLRTLNASSNAVLGMPAALYLRRRRLHGARRSLRDGSATSVTEAATRHGFWELGRFAGDYRAFFGETPSATLRASGGRVATAG